jgi:hypothetical protein
MTAQCPGGYSSSGVAYDTTISVYTGKSTREIKFPKVDPTTSMVTCMKITMTITGVMKTLQIENLDDNNSIHIRTKYDRKDTLVGLGLSSPLTNTVVKTYESDLAPYDYIDNSGPDYLQIDNDTILNAVSVTSIITDSTDLTNFYGPPGDSVSYFYTINASTIDSLPALIYKKIITAGFVNLKIEYCTCPKVALPINIYDFSIQKVDDTHASLRWKTNNDPENYYYEIEYSRDGTNFYTAGIVEKQTGSTPTFTYNYFFTRESGGRYYFRVKQKFASGKVLVSVVKLVDFGTSVVPKFSLYPNPSNGVIGIKFDKNTSGKLLIQITNAQGQTVIKKQVDVVGDSYQQVATLQGGMYWLRVTDVTSQLSCVNQLLIK